MSRESDMGNCNSKRQESADCGTNNGTNPHPSDPGQLGTPHSNLNQDNVVIQEQVTSRDVRSNLGSSQQQQTPPKSNGDMSQQSFSGVSGNTSLHERSRTENDAVIDLTRAQVNSLLDGIHQFQGTSSNDKDYRYLDEMLTRCILKLDTIECNDSQDRANRKEAIRGVNEAISILERKLQINTEIKHLETDLQTE